MHLLYVDESGTPSDSTLNHFVLSGISVFEKQTHWIEQEMNAIAARFNADDPYERELHGSPMRGGRDGWKNFSFNDRKQAIKDCLALLTQKHRDIRIFACVVPKGALDGKDVITESFYQISSRFDMYLSRLHRQGATSRGVAIFDKSSTEKSIQSLARTFKDTGYEYGKLRNFSEVPLFLDSKASRLIQLADLVSYSIFRKFEFNDDEFYKIIENRFDYHNGKVHGLYVAH